MLNLHFRRIYTNFAVSNQSLMDHRTLVARVASKLGKNKTDVTRLLDALVGVVTSHAAEMDSVSVPGFGTFEPVKHEEQVRRDEATGKRMLMPPSIELQFHPSNILKSKLK